MKQCCKCGEVKNLSFFPKHPHCKQGVNSRCKACVNAQVRKYRSSDEGKAKDKERQRQRWIDNKNRMQAKRKERDNLHPRRRKANNAVQTAVRNDTLCPPSACNCNDCQLAPAVDFHHHSYDEEHWLDVVPLCRSCHQLRHSHPERFQ